MAVDERNSDLEDPFADISVLSLLPRTLGAGIHADAAPSEAQDRESFQNLLKSTALRGSSELLEEVQAINKGILKISTVASKNGDKPVAANGKDHPQGRRPALGRKRAQFSLKSNSSHVPDVDFSSSIDHIEDPEEYFLAIEQLENADKELKKLRGDLSTDLVQHPQSTAARKRRPGIPGKTASYKHHFSAKIKDAKTFKVMQEEIPDIRSSSPSKTSTAKVSTNILHPEANDQPDTSQSKKTDSELLDAVHKEGSVAEKGKELNFMLDNLLSSFEDLDEDEGAVLLRKSLQITSIDVGKVHLPDLCSSQKSDLRIFSNRVAGKSLEDIQLPQTSTVARSPLDAMSILHRRISLKPLEDPYSEAASDDSPNSRCSSRSRGQDKHPLSPTVDRNHRDRSDVVVGNDFATVMANEGRLILQDKIDTPFSEADRDTVSKIARAEEATDHSLCLPENTMDHSFSRADDVKNLSAGPDGDLEDEGNDMRIDDSISGQPGEVSDLTSARADCGGSEGLSRPLNREVAQDCGISEMDVDTGLHVLDDPLQEQQDQLTDMAQEEPVVGSELSKGHSSPSAVVLPVDGQSENICNLPEENNETERCQAASGLSLNQEKKHKASRRKQDKKKSRQSLADAGMIWKSGVRRSTRIKSRPLEYWRGERFLYGRIHDSLATVIGLKYSSPGKEGEGEGLKVKSFVSEEYADLVAQAALH